MEAEAERRRRAEVLQSEGDRQSEASMVGELGERKGRRPWSRHPVPNLVYTLHTRVYIHIYIYTCVCMLKVEKSAKSDSDPKNCSAGEFGRGEDAGGHAPGSR